MIPADIVALCEGQLGDTYLKDPVPYRRALSKLGIDQNTEIFEFMSTIVAGNCFSQHSGEQLRAVLNSIGEIDPGVEFANVNWKIPPRYFPLTSLEGEGGFFYDKETKKVVDVELAHIDEFMSGDVKIVGETFFDFIRWFLSPSGKARGYGAS
jgi:hypothetical protein